MVPANDDILWGCHSRLKGDNPIAILFCRNFSRFTVKKRSKMLTNEQNSAII